MTVGVLIAATLFGAFLYSGKVARSSPPFVHGSGYVDTHLVGFRNHVNNVRASKCLSRYRYERSDGYIATLDVGSPQRRYMRWIWKVRHMRSHAAASQCIPAFPWMALASCESGRNWTYNGSSGFDGAFQFLPSTWRSAVGNVPGASAYAYAYQAPPVVQYRVARAWLAETGWEQWPACSRKLGLL